MYSLEHERNVEGNEISQVSKKDKRVRIQTLNMKTVEESKNYWKVKLQKMKEYGRRSREQSSDKDSEIRLQGKKENYRNKKYKKIQKKTKRNTIARKAE